ncbi:hypothetical protein COCCADRAFT_42094 [Bipolaris zeicola 26-R-13]|uniref:Uncharacterized protein n=1 Tax=Cochliobolus carbonum (strain 26-R-13) TaxID=930089 RepID=W6XP70_COCC2|nr:uncharacterized protein COCCADRAFT_42094 [Bipolaris zeicola 26-R-13]EUC27055.1 hypothetical protein COCCADRAFT_42094 [Bipolaris zeicola 26-R-13]
MISPFSLQILFLALTTHATAVPTSTFCDNIPRLLGRQYSAFVTEWYPRTAVTTHPSITIPTPTCTVNGNDCAKLRSSWSLAHATETPIPQFPVPCEAYRACSSVPSGPCTLAGSGIKIYYWPTPATQPLCPQTNTLMPISRPTPEAGKPKSPVVKVIDGLTVTSPSIYISIPTLYGQLRGVPTNLFTGCGSQLTSLTLSIPPSPISTLTRRSRVRRPTFESPKPFALSTLNWPVSATEICSEQTFCEWNNAISTCTDVLSTICVTPTINPYDYNPALLLPTDLVGLAAKQEGSYQNCVVHRAAAADATWIPITTLAGDPRYTQGWSSTSTILPVTLTAAPTPEITSNR